MKFELLIKHLTGLLLSMSIVFLAALIDNVEKFPSIYSRLPVRYVVKAEQDVKLYECDEFRKRKQIGILKAGEIADLEMVTCGGSGTYWTVRLSDGTSACHSADDEDKTVKSIRNFYYF